MRQWNGVCVGMSGLYILSCVNLIDTLSYGKKVTSLGGCLRTSNKLVLNVIVCSSALSTHPRARYNGLYV